MRTAKSGSRWRIGVWTVLLGCLVVVAAMLVQGLFPTADFMFKLEVFGALFVAGCVLLLVSRHSGRRARNRTKRQPDRR